MLLAKLVPEVINMRKRNMKDWLKGKGFYISLMVGAICVVAIAAVCLDSFGVNNSMSDEDKRNNIAKLDGENEDDDIIDNSDVEKNARDFYDRISSENDNSSDLPQQAEVTPVPEDVTDTASVDSNKEDGKKDKKSDSKKTSKKSNKKNDEKKDSNSDSSDKKVTVMKTGDKINSLKFDQEAGISWPVTGDILMKYSAGNTVYHKTLGQYKSNPALVISAAEGSNVSSSVDSVVTDIGKNEEIGNYIETSIGDGYKIIYGQLDNIQVKKGDTLKEGELIGAVAAPTKYYIEEGSNLYMKMTCDNEPVDPMIFLK